MILVFFVMMNSWGCNLCPTFPDGESSNPKDNVYSTIIPMNSNTPIITKISVNSFLFSEVADNGYIFSPPALNGNYAFIRIDENQNGKILMLGNTVKNTTQVLEKEGKDFSIFHPIISSKGDRIAFLGGSNQLFIWVINEQTNSSFIDKVSGKVNDNSIPIFSSDGNSMAFLEKETDNSVKLKLIESNNPDNIKFERTFSAQHLAEGIDNYLTLSSDNNLVAFVSENDSLNFINILNLEKSELNEIRIPKENFGIKIAKISPDGKNIAVSANDGNIWIISLTSELPLFSKITNTNSLNYFLYFDWNKEGDKLLAQSYNRNDDLNKGSTLYIIQLEKSDDLMKMKDITLFCNNIQRAYWGN